MLHQRLSALHQYTVTVETNCPTGKDFFLLYALMKAVCDESHRQCLLPLLLFLLSLSLLFKSALD